MDPLNYISRYQDEFASLVQTVGRERAMDLIVGGEYLQIGILELSVLLSVGLKPGFAVIDVGCGSGRLAFALRSYLRGRYLGTDILGEALSFARERVRRDDWQFLQTSGAGIPAEDGKADVVCFFSVFTHLLDEDIFRYIKEAKRVLKRGGRIIFSYLDFEVASHWTIFEQSLHDQRPERPLNKFVSKPAIVRWSEELDLNVERLIDGDQRWISLTEDFHYADGRAASGVVEFGQSIALLVKGE